MLLTQVFDQCGLELSTITCNDGPKLKITHAHAQTTDVCPKRCWCWSEHSWLKLFPSQGWNPNHVFGCPGLVIEWLAEQSALYVSYLYHPPLSLACKPQESSYSGNTFSMFVAGKHMFRKHMFRKHMFHACLDVQLEPMIKFIASIILEVTHLFGR